MRNLLNAAALVAFILAATACGGSSSSAGAGGSSTGGDATTGAGGGPSVTQACADSAHAVCTKRDTCSTNGFENAEAYGSEAICETRSALTCPNAIAAKGSAQTAAHTDQCVAAYPGYACSDYFDGNPPAVCVPPVGTLMPGEPCGASAQCQSSFCATGPYQVCGTCQPLPTPGPAAMCQVQADCGRNLACVKPAGATPQTVGQCTAWVPMGGACLTDTMPCESGLVCQDDDVMTMTLGKCVVAAATVGAACNTDRQMAPSCNFDLGLQCIPTDMKSGVGACQAIALAGAGQPCDAIPGGSGASYMLTSFAVCEAGGLCKKAVATDNHGTCMAAAADGAACDSDVTKGPSCLLPAKCVPAMGSPVGTTAGTCVVPDATKCM